MTPAGFPHSDTPGSKLARSSPGRFVACHVLHRLLAPRHPPRALCSLTSLNNSPEGSCRQRSGKIHLVVLSSAEIEVQKRLNFFRSRLHFVRCREPELAVPAIRWSVTSRLLAWSPRIRGQPVGDTTRRLEDSSRLDDQPGLLFESVRGLPDLQFHRQVCGQQTAYLASCPVLAGLVETRRLELLTLSLQRRCSSN